jgi:sec-independent protein translocase protein TatC
VGVLGLRWRRRTSQFERAADGSMTLMEHLRELRERLFKACLGILAGMVIGWFLSEWVLNLLQSPYCDLTADIEAKANGGTLPEDWKCKFVQLGVADVLLLNLKIAMWVGLILAAPIWMYQLWAFVAPGLHRHERRWAYAFASVAAPLFALGAVLAYFVVSTGLDFLLDFTGDNVETQLEITRYIDFVTGLMLLFGVAFEFPLIVLLLNIAGVLSARRLLGWWRAAVFGFFLFAAVATPTADPFGMTALGLALSSLYFGAVGLAFLNDRRRRRRDHENYANLSDDETSPLEYDRASADEIDPVAAATPIDVPESVSASAPVGGPEPVAAPQPLDNRYDDLT